MIITFPKNEWDDIKSRLSDDKVVYTVRVSDECGKFQTGDVATTEWGLPVRILSIEKLTGGIEELKNRYVHFGKLTENAIKEISAFGDVIEVIALKPVKS